MSEKDVSASGSFSVAEIFGEPVRRDAILMQIQSSKVLSEWNTFSPEDQEKILLFLEGKKGLQILNDRFFQKVFRPDICPERIGSFISAVLGEHVTIERILSREGTGIAEAGSLVIMDIIVRTDSGATVSVEMQRIGYMFPGQRTSCYLSDMIMRQYQTVRSQMGKDFSYSSLKPVTLIVIMEKSSKEFKKAAPAYIHKRISHYDTGVKVTDLENVVYISLDTFGQKAENEIGSELDAWLTFFSKNDTEDIIKLVKAYPQFLPMYKEIAEFRKSPEEVIGMFSEELRILDRNTTLYMLDQYSKELDEVVAARDEAVAARDKAVEARDKAVEARDKAEEKLDAALAARDEEKARADEAVAKANAKLDAAYALLKANGIPIPDV